VGFPPRRHIAEVIQLIERYWINCILIVPEQIATNWWIMIFQWSLARKIERYEIPRGTQACKKSRRVPANTANPGLFKLRAFRIEW
jgi:hypothetical protein